MIDFFPLGSQEDMVFFINLYDLIYSISYNTFVGFCQLNPGSSGGRLLDRSGKENNNIFIVLHLCEKYNPLLYSKASYPHGLSAASNLLSWGSITV